MTGSSKRGRVAIAVSVVLSACGSARPSAPAPTAAPPGSSAPSSAPRAAPAAPASGPPAPDGGAAAPGSTVEISAGGAQLRLSRFEPTVAIRSDGSRVALILAGPTDGGVALLFDTTTGTEVQRWVPAHGTGWGAGFKALQSLPDGRLLAIEHGQLQVLSEDGSVQQLWSGGIALASADGQWVASLGEDGLTVRTIGGAPIALDRGLRRLQTLTFSSDGTRLAVVRNASTDDQPTGNTEVLVFDRHQRSWRRAAALTVSGARQENDAAFLSHERLLVDDEVLDLSTGARSPSSATGLSAVSTDGSMLLFSGGDGTARWARVLDGQIGPIAAAERPPAFANRGLPVAISALGQVLWCTGTSCGLGPAAR